MSITTKFGDTGKTRLCCGGVISKYSDRMAACGDVDALVSSLGLAKAQVLSQWTGCGCLMVTYIEDLQRDCFTIGSEVACDIENLHQLKTRIDLHTLAKLEVKREDLEKQITMPKDFILPGNNLLSANLDMARVYCRTLERSIVKLIEQGLVKNDYLLIFVNRMSDYLYLLARSSEGNTYTPQKMGW